MNTQITQSPQLLSAKELAKVMSLSPRTVFRLRSSRRLPFPVYVGSSLRWRLSDIKLFLECDCDMAKFKAMKQSRGNNG